MANSADEVLRAMWAGGELTMATGCFGTPLGFTLKPIGGEPLAIDTSVIAELNGSKHIEPTTQYIGPRKKQYVLSDAGLAAIGKPSKQKMKQVSVFHGVEKK